MARPDLVSVLMPAFKTEFLREAMSSVLHQTHGELELLIGDNSGDPEIGAIVAEFDDPRVVHIPSHAVSGGSVQVNHMLLWWRARGRYVRFVYDDDVAYPRSTEVLLDLLKGQPGAAMAWHQRDIIDAESRVLGRPDPLGSQARVVMDRPLLLVNLAQRMNFLGEPSFCMFDREVHRDFKFSTYEGMPLRFLWDVAMSVDAARSGLLVGTAEFLGGFRKHGAQISTALGRNFVFGCVEWEVIFRNELARGNLAPPDATLALQRLALLYERYQAEVPALVPFRERLLADLADGRAAERTPQFNDAYRSLARDHV